jgi:hypothetical protein
MKNKIKPHRNAALGTLQVIEAGVACMQQAPSFIDPFVHFVHCLPCLFDEKNLGRKVLCVYAHIYMCIYTCIYV